MEYLMKVDVWFVKIVDGPSASKLSNFYFSKISTSFSFCKEFSLDIKESVTS